MLVKSLPATPTYPTANYNVVLNSGPAIPNQYSAYNPAILNPNPAPHFPYGSPALPQYGNPALPAYANTIPAPAYGTPFGTPIAPLGSTGSGSIHNPLGPYGSGAYGSGTYGSGTSFFSTNPTSSTPSTAPNPFANPTVPSYANQLPRPNYGTPMPNSYAQPNPFNAPLDQSYLSSQFNLR
jgi:hypothetical protein